MSRSDDLSPANQPWCCDVLPGARSVDRHRDGPGRGRGPRSGSVACPCRTVSRSFSAIIAGNGRSASTRARRIVPQPGTELEEFFDLTIDLAVHRRLRRRLQARERRRSSAPSGIPRPELFSRSGARHHPSGRRAAGRARRWRSSRRDTIWSGSNRASAAPKRFGEFRARCREELAGQADKLNELCARERPRVRRPSSTARATESTTTPRSSPELPSDR